MSLSLSCICCLQILKCRLYPDFAYTLLIHMQVSLTLDRDLSHSSIIEGYDRILMVWLVVLAIEFFCLFF